MSAFGQSSSWQRPPPFGIPRQSPFGSPGQNPFGGWSRLPVAGTLAWTIPDVDTAKEPFQPLVEYEMDEQSVYQNICCQDTYRQHSQEELRLADYKHGHRYGSTFGARPWGFGSTASDLASSSSFGSGGQGLGGFACQRSLSSPGQQKLGGFASTTGPCGFESSVSSPFGKYVNIGGFTSLSSHPGQGAASSGLVPGSSNFSTLGPPQLARPSWGDTSREFSFCSGPRTEQNPAAGFTFPTTRPVGRKPCENHPGTCGSLFSRTSQPHLSGVSGQWGQSPQQSQWQSGQTQRPGIGTSVIGGGIDRSASTGAPNPMRQQQVSRQTTSPQTTGRQMTTRIDDISAYGAPWLFAEEKQHQRQMHDERPSAVRSAGQRPRHRSMSPGFKYTEPVFASRQMSPSSWFRYRSRTPPGEGRSRAKSST